MKNTVFISFFALLIVCFSSVSQAVTIDFDSLVEDQKVTNQFPEATFSSEQNFFLWVTNSRDFGNSQPYFICTGRTATQSCTEDVFVDFTNPVNDLTFLAVGDNDAGAVGVVDVYSGLALQGSASIIGNSNANDPIFVDLTAFSNVTRISIRDITDAYGLGYDDFTFVPVPEPGTFFLIGAGIAVLFLERRRLC